MMRYISLTASGAHPASYPLGTVILTPWDKAAGAWSWITHLHLVPRIKMHGAIPPCLLCACVIWCLIIQETLLHSMQLI